MVQSRFKQSRKLFFWTVELEYSRSSAFYFILQMPNIFSTNIRKMLSAIFLPCLLLVLSYYMFDPIVVFLGEASDPECSVFM